MMERDDTRARASRGPCRPWGGGGGGGVGSPPRRFPTTSPAGARWRAVGAAAVALTALLAASPAAVAQICAPTGYTGTLPTVAYDGTTTAIFCQTLTGGLEMTLGPDLQLGTEASPLTERGIFVDADGDGNNDIVVMGSGTIYTNQSGIRLQRDGTGLLKLEFTAGRIVSGGTNTEGFGIALQHKGEAGEEAKGIHLVSGADIDLSAHTSNAKAGIHAYTTGAPADATIPIEIRVTGGTIDVSDPASSTPTVGGKAIQADQYAKGDIAITVEKAAMLGTKEAVAGAYGIEAWLRADSEGDIAITHRGGIHGGDGIFARSDATSAEKGSITITTDAGSMIVAKEVKEYDNINEAGILAEITEAASTGDITITHNGEIEADGKGINPSNSGKGDITVTTGAGSKITAGGGGIEASGGSAITIAHNGEIDADGDGISATNSGTGDVTVTTGTGSKVVGGEKGIEVWLRSAGEGDITITHRGGIEAAAGDGIYVQNAATSAKKGHITITTEVGSTIVAQGSGNDGIFADIIAAASTGAITTTHKGSIEAEDDGISTSNGGTGSITVTTETGSKIVAKGYGINAWINEGTNTGAIKITHRGAIEAGKRGIYTYSDGTGSVTVTTGAGSTIVARGEDVEKDSGIRAGLWGAASTADVTVTHGGEITAKGTGINAFNRVASAGGTGAVSVTTGKGARSPPTNRASWSGIRAPAPSRSPSAAWSWGTVRIQAAATPTMPACISR